MTENWRQSEICIVTNLTCDALLHYKFIIQFAGERIFKIGEHLVKKQAKWLIVLYVRFAS